MVPNTLEPHLFDLDWACINSMFSSCLHPSAHPHNHVSDASSFSRHFVISSKDKLSADAQQDGDVALKNLVGANAHKIAKKWVDQQSIFNKLKVIRKFVGDKENAMIDKLLGIARPRGRHHLDAPSSDPPQYLDKGKGRQITISRYHDRDSEEDTDDSHDERGRTADFLFGAQAGIDIYDKENSWLSSEASQEGAEFIENVENVNEVVPVRGRAEPGGDGAWRLNCLTPESSPVRRPKKSLNSPPSTPASSKRNPPAHPIGLGSARVQTSQVTRSVPNLANAKLGNSRASPICLVSSSPETPSNSKSHKILLPHSPLTGSHGFSSGGISALPLESSVHASSALKRKVTASFEASVNLDERLVQNSSVSNSTPCNKRSKLELGHSMAILNCEQEDIKPHVAASVHDHARPLLQSHSTIPHIPSEKEQLQLQQERIRTSDDLAILYPDRVNPSYSVKRNRQLARMDRKQQTPEGDTATKSNPLPSMPRRNFLAPAPTVPAIDTVEGEGSMTDTTNSRQLEAKIRDDRANGRRVKIPAIQCTES